MISELIKQRTLLQAQINGINDMLLARSRWGWIEILTNNQVLYPVIKMLGDDIVIEFQCELGTKRLIYNDQSTFEDFQVALNGWLAKETIDARLN